MWFPKNRVGLVLAALLVTIAHLATEVTVGETHGVVAWTVVKFVVIALCAATITARSWSEKWSPNALTTLAVIAALLGPLAIEPVWRLLFGTGHAWELQLIIGLRNVALVCLVWGVTRRFEILAGLASLFTLLFCVSAGRDTALLWISGAYVLVGVSWLVVGYWNSLRTDPIVGQQKLTARWLMPVVAVLLVGAISLIAVPSQTRMRMVEGFLPSSGGTGDRDPFARSGVGDGDALVAATQEALSFAPLEEAPFLEGNEPSLYDMFQDSYGATKPPKKMERAISLPPELFQQNHERMAKAKKSSRTFSVDRERPEPAGHRHLEDTPSNALLHLVGPVPAHLRHTTYDLFDGREWYPQDFHGDHQPNFQVRQRNERPWIEWPRYAGAFTNTEWQQHALRVLNVKTNRVLAPANLQAIHIDRCDRPDLFTWAQPDIVAMDRDELPGMTVIHVVSQLIDPLPLIQDDVALSYGVEEYRGVPTGPGMADIVALAQQWTADAGTDWEKAIAIRDRLRTEYVWDPDLVVPAACENPLQWFLFESRRGPDYLFASAAAILGRAVGLSTRTVSGFYADPDKFEFATQQTSVHPSDTHWWAEVYLGRQTWITLEATPGYEQRDVPRGLWATLQLWWGQAWRAAWQAWPVSLGVIGGLLIGFRRRRTLWARCLLWLWSCRFPVPPATPDGLRKLLIATCQVWDQRLQLLGEPRPPSWTPTQLLNAQSAEKLSAGERQQLAAAFDWAFYATPAVPPQQWTVRQLHRGCRQLLWNTSSVATRARGAVSQFPRRTL